MASAWRFEPVTEIQPIQAPARQRARGAYHRWWARLRGLDPEDERESMPDRLSLRPVSEARLESLVPDPPLDAQRAAFHAVRGGRYRALLLRPDDGSWDAVLNEDDPLGPHRPQPPASPPWRASLPGDVRERLRDPNPVHVPRLERWLLRHHDGIAAIREILSLLGTREGPWSADVAPWSWAWMRNVLPETRALPSPLAVAPMHGEALQDWFEPVGEVRVRRLGTDRPDASLFESLSARARGRAGVAAAIWRVCVEDGAERTHADTEPVEESDRADGTVWMRHPRRVDLPHTRGMDRDDLLVLHAVLIHGGASRETIRRAIGLPPGTTDASLAAGVAHDLLEVDDEGRHRVAPAALPAVEDRLRVEAFARVDA